MRHTLLLASFTVLAVACGPTHKDFGPEPSKEGDAWECTFEFSYARGKAIVDYEATDERCFDDSSEAYEYMTEWAEDCLETLGDKYDAAQCGGRCEPLEEEC